MRVRVQVRVRVGVPPFPLHVLVIVQGLVVSGQEKRGVSNWVIVMCRFDPWGSVSAYFIAIVLQEALVLEGEDNLLCSLTG